MERLDYKNPPVSSSSLILKQNPKFENISLNSNSGDFESKNRTIGQDLSEAEEFQKKMINLCPATHLSKLKTKMKTGFYGFVKNFTLTNNN